MPFVGKTPGNLIPKYRDAYRGEKTPGNLIPKYRDAFRGKKAPGDLITNYRYAEGRVVCRS